MAHLREPGNGRITLMFCAFEGVPRILRIFGHGMLSLVRQKGTVWLTYALHQVGPSSLVPQNMIRFYRQTFAIQVLDVL